MALSKRPAAQNSEPVATTQAPNASVQSADDAQPVPVAQLDGAGNAVNEGDANAAPVTSTGPQSTQAEENKEPTPEPAKKPDKEPESSGPQSPAAKENTGSSDEEDDDEEPAQKLVKVTNVSQFDQRQYSTGLWIGAGETGRLAEDGWLRSQIKAGILVKGAPKKKED